MNKLRLFGGVVLGFIAFFVVGIFWAMILSNLTRGDWGFMLSPLMTALVVGALYWLIREYERSVALGLLVGAGCALLLFGSCVLLLMNTSFH